MKEMIENLCTSLLTLVEELKALDIEGMHSNSDSVAKNDVVMADEKEQFCVEYFQGEHVRRSECLYDLVPATTKATDLIRQGFKVKRVVKRTVMKTVWESVKEYD